MKTQILSSKRNRRKAKIRETISGTANMPRLSIFRSNKYIYAQLIDDVKGVTLVDVFAESKKLHEKAKKSEAAFETGKTLAKKAQDKKISKAVFDRNGYRYHGRVKSLADGAREGGLVF
ncbi:MAG TPA: 50S ribosomal protein L18 [Candidatus Saccharimonadales bacterium]|nr:50S ribosomal protein L18 [Candidatus Saccharimonadales bacterium]